MAAMCVDTREVKKRQHRRGNFKHISYIHVKEMKIEEIGDGGVEENNVKVQHSRIHAWKFLIYSTSFLHFRHSSSSFHFQIFLFSLHRPTRFLSGEIFHLTISLHTLCRCWGSFFPFAHSHNSSFSWPWGDHTAIYYFSPCRFALFRPIFPTFNWSFSRRSFIPFHFFAWIQTFASSREKKANVWAFVVNKFPVLSA